MTAIPIKIIQIMVSQLKKVINTLHSHIKKCAKKPSVIAALITNIVLHEMNAESYMWLAIFTRRGATQPDR